MPTLSAAPRRRTMRAGLLAALAAATFGAAAAPAVAAPPDSPNIAVLDPSIDLGLVDIGDPPAVEPRFEVGYPSGLWLEGEGHLSEGGEVDVTGPTQPRLESQPVRYRIEFKDLALGEHTLKVTLRFINPAWEREEDRYQYGTVTIRYEGVEGPLYAPPLDFGQWPVGGAPAYETLTVTNVSAHPVPVSSGELKEIFDGPGASIAQAPGWPSFPLTIEPEASIDLPLKFQPIQNGPEANSVILDLSPAGTPPYTETAWFDVTGEGVGAAPNLALGAGSIAFGDVWVGTKVTRTVRLTNTGPVALYGLGGSVTGAGANRYAVSGVPSTLGVGAYADVKVTFTASARGSVPAAALAITGGNRPLAIPLSAKAIAPVAGYSTKSIWFGRPAKGSSVKRTVTVKNTGDANLTFNAVKITGKDAARFSFTGATKTTLAPGASRTFTVTFKPTATGNRRATLAFSTNAVPYGPVNVELNGTGV